MSAYYRNNGYEEEPDYPNYPGSRNHTQGYLETRDYPGSLNNSAYSKTWRNPYSADSRTSPDYPRSLAEPDYPGSFSNPDYPGIRNDPYSASPRRHPDYPRSLAEPDYPGSQNNSDYPGTRSNPYSAGSRSSDYPTSLAKPDSPWSNPYHPYSFKGPDYSEFQRNPDLEGSRSGANYAGSRTNTDDLGFLGEPDYPGAQGNANHPGHRANSIYPGSTRNGGYASSRIKPSIDTLGEPDYPGAENQPYSPNFLEEPDYPGAEDYWNSPNFVGEPDYPNAEDGRDYGSFKTPEIPTELLSRTSSVHHGHVSPLGLLVRQNEEYPEDIEMNSMERANPYGRSDNGYVNPAYVDESSSGPAYGNSQSGGDWYTSPQGQKLIASLIPMTSRDRIKAIRNQPRTMEEKRKLRRMVDKEKSKQSRRIFELNCCTQCLNSISRAYRRSKNILSELLNSISLWQKTLKIIGGKFGTSVLSYFNFLRWLLKFNIFSFIVTFSFITIPQFTVGRHNTLQFTGLEFFTGAGYFTDTVMYYGFYTNSTIQHQGGGASYNMQLAYIFTIAACLIICFFSLLFSMARYFRNNFINPHIYSRGIAKLIFCWDFTITHERAVKLKQKNLSTEIRVRQAYF